MGESTAQVVKKINHFRDFVKDTFGLPFLVTAFALAVANLIQHNKCVDDPNKFKEDSLVKLFYWGSISIIVFCILVTILEMAPALMG